LGAVIGAFLSAFLLIELFGVNRTLWLVSALNLLLAMVARWMSQQQAFARQEPPEKAADDEQKGGLLGAPADSDPGETHSTAPPVAAALILPAAGVVGCIFFLMELVWYRMLAPVLGGSSYTFGLILAVALFGIGAGGLLFALGPRSRRPTLQSLAVTCVLEALFVVLPFAAGDQLAILAVTLRPLGGLGFYALVLGWACVTSIVVLPAALIAGYQFPLLLALLGSGQQRVGSQVGLAYAWNTWGAILGSLAGGFGLLPLLGALSLWRLSVLLLALLGATIAGVAWWGDRRPGRLLLPLGCGLLSLGLCMAPGPSAFWRHHPIGAGRVKAEFHGSDDLRHRLHEVRRALVREADGVESSVALMRRNELSLYVNGKSDGSARNDAPTTVMSGMVGALLHPGPRRVLVIGLGTGTTAGWLAQVDTVEAVDIVELEPTVVELARHFDPITFEVLDLPGVRLLLGDGREYVLTTPDSYDLVFSEPSNPYRAGVADLFSQEFYRAIHKRLNTDGIFLQWLQGYEVDANVVQIAYATISSVFPHVESWQVNADDLLLVASREPLVHDLDLVRARVAQEPFRSALRWTWRVEGVEGFYSGFVGSDGLRAALVAARSQVSTDDRPLIEFGFARNVGREGLFSVRELLSLAERIGANRPSILDGSIDWERVRELRQTRSSIDAFVGQPPSASSPAQQSRMAAREAYRRGDLVAAESLWLSQDHDPICQLDRFLLAESLAEGGDARAPAWLEQLRPVAPTEAMFLAARSSWRAGDAQSTVDHLGEAFESLRTDPWVFRPLVARGFELAEDLAAVYPEHGRRLFAALDEPFPVMLFEEVRLATRINLAAKVNFATLCVAAFSPLEPHVLWQERFLDARKRCYEQTHHPLAAKAREDLAEYLADAPPRLETEP
ncbi:MAG: spermidine synthase, partial [bacterium]|nr:spermidine synthase [bacterium]